MKTAATIAISLAALAVLGVLLWDNPASSGEDGTEANLLASAPVPQKERPFYWTTPGIEPDTCIAAWLLTRLVTPGAAVKVVEDSAEGIPFDMPDNTFQREPGSSVSDIVIREHQLEDPFANRLAAVARELELMPWTTNPDPFFNQVRAGLAEAVNVKTGDEAGLQAALDLLDNLKLEWSASKESHTVGESPESQ
jgi:hypothetical protein